MSPIRGRRPMLESDRVGSDNSDDPSYKEKRSRNNYAVKKSRQKAKERTQEMENQVNELVKENDKLMSKIELLQSELEKLKNDFIAHADTRHSKSINPQELDSLLDSADPDHIPETVQQLINKAEGRDTSASTW